MATLQRLIASTFLDELAKSDQVDADKIAQLRALLADGKRPKPDELVKIFSGPAGGDLK